MNSPETNVLQRPSLFETDTRHGATSWGAIVAGAVAAAALSLILLALGTGLGLSSVSPWAYEGASSTAVGFGAIFWLLLMSALASGVGGYIAGRLRSKWIDIDGDEAFFRDTAHGLLAWAVATLLSAAVLTSAASSMVGTAAKAAADGAAAGVANAPEASRGYFVDMMFRTGKPVESSLDMTATRREANLILAQAATGDLSPADRAHLAQMVMNRTGVSQAEADQRVTETTNAAKLASDAAVAKTKEVAEVARKATAHTALWVFVSLLLGAFCAAWAATWGGRERDGDSYTRRFN